MRKAIQIARDSYLKAYLLALLRSRSLEVDGRKRDVRYRRDCNVRLFFSSAEERF